MYKFKLQKSLCILVIFTIVLSVCQIQIKPAVSAAATKVAAFPGAEGGGMYATGARGGGNMEVYHVNSLADSGSGTLRDAVSQSNRIIVFDVAGNIELNHEANGELKITGSNLTILGQTAPGDGICVTGNNVVVLGSNIIMRYLRFRMGDNFVINDSTSKDAFDSKDTLGGRGTDNVIIDHCSVSWSIDECASFYQNTNFTMQWCIISESLNSSTHSKGNHGYGGIWGGENASFHHNLLAHHSSRNPRIAEGNFTGNDYDLFQQTWLTDMRNNVIYNWGQTNSAYGGQSAMPVNIINCYYKAGPATTKGSRGNGNDLDKRIFQMSAQGNGNYVTWSTDLYVDGNIVEGADGVTNNNVEGIIKDAQAQQYYVWTDGKIGTSSAGIEYKSISDNPQAQKVHFGYEDEYPITTETAEEAYESVLAGAGASIVRDSIDERVINDVRTGTANHGNKGIINTSSDSDPLPKLTGTPAKDSDGDGIPNEWEDQNGLNKLDKSDALKTTDSGYTYIEEYANELADGSYVRDVDYDSDLGEMYTASLIVSGGTGALNGESAVSRATYNIMEGTDVTYKGESYYNEYTETMTVTGANGANITVNNGKFTMPSQNVTVRVVYSQIAAPTPTPAKNDIKTNTIYKIDDIVDRSLSMMYGWELTNSTYTANYENLGKPFGELENFSETYEYYLYGSNDVTDMHMNITESGEYTFFMLLREYRDRGYIIRFIKEDTGKITELDLTPEVLQTRIGRFANGYNSDGSITYANLGVSKGTVNLEPGRYTMEFIRVNGSYLMAFRIDGADNESIPTPTPMPTSTSTPTSAPAPTPTSTPGAESLFLYEIIDGKTVTILRYRGSEPEVDVPAEIEGLPVTMIGVSAFNGDSFITGITLPDTVTEIGSFAFRNCTRLTSIRLSDSLTKIKSGAFYYCGKLENITLPDSLKTISSNAFYSAGLKEITIPAGVSDISNLAFHRCLSLSVITVDGDNPNYCSIDGVMFSKDVAELIICPAGKFGSYTIPDSVTTVGSYAFRYCDDLTEIIIPDNVTEILDNAFSGCDSLKSVTISNNVTYIGDYVFESCDNLDNVILPDGITSIGMNAFSGCKNLTTITIPNSVTSIKEYAFLSDDALTDVYFVGTEEEWNLIDIERYNDPLFKDTTTIHFITTPEPTATPTSEPTATPTVEPTATPTTEPTATPTTEPTATPTTEPTATPTAEPMATPLPSGVYYAAEPALDDGAVNAVVVNTIDKDGAWFIAAVYSDDVLTDIKIVTIPYDEVLTVDGNVMRLNANALSAPNAEIRFYLWSSGTLTPYSEAIGVE